MDGVDAYQGLFLAIQEAQFCQDRRVELARISAQARLSYKRAKRQRILAERHKGTPTTYLKDVVEGYCDISLLAFHVEVSEAEEASNHEQELLSKKQIDTYREILAMEERQVSHGA